ncbi:hypothetical protein [Microbulbifer mangrovi]|uniref:hypothetical protein n=1 Tax=Microbulbifer mangrovi TaxID=927787 RepID=UPI00099060DC|nr:hypothetical protein [Microbulbifer mangrovi]
MQRDRRKVKNRQESGRFCLIPHSVLDYPGYVGLNYSARAMLLELVRRYNGINNGDISAPYSQLRHRGFASKGTISNALKQLLSARLIVASRDWQFYNRNSYCALYALGWRPIDDCDGKHDLAPTNVAPHSYRQLS